MDIVSDINLTKWLVAVGLLCLCMCLLAILAKRYGPQGRSMMGGRRMQLMELMHLDPRHKLCLFRFDDMEHLVLLGPNGSTHLEAKLKGETTEEIKEDIGIGFLKKHPANTEQMNEKEDS